MDTRKFNDLLNQEKERLERELSSIAKPDPKMLGDWDAKFPEGSDPVGGISSGALEEQADLREEFETNVAQEHALEERLAEVNGAIARITEGTYGLCANCKQPIPEERLIANPAAAYDMEHQPK